MIKIPAFDELIQKAPKELQVYHKKCDETEQGTDWHAEGCVGIHNRIVYDRAKNTGDINLVLGAFFHDLGKVDTSAPNKKGGISAIGHERVSAKLAEKYSSWIEEMGGDASAVYEIVKEHMRIKYFDVMKKAKQEKLRQNPYFKELLQFSDFDNMKTLTKDELNRYK